ncbi:UNVERIFIED_CONTAM: Transcription factor AS1 [Sesamum radiatum]|uniref:Transcription factor AS1 n=1 Tax=Sesamum radiatum TaxID=300843 RepID=A0AAW2R5L4_SESRA
METSNGGFLRTDSPATSTPKVLPPWLVSSSMTTTVRPPYPSVTLSLSSSTAPPAPEIAWLQPDNTSHSLSILQSFGIAPVGENPQVAELVDCCRELEEGHRAWVAHRKEAAWRLKRVELQLESERDCRRREKVEEKRKSELLGKRRRQGASAGCRKQKVYSRIRGKAEARGKAPEKRRSKAEMQQSALSLWTVSSLGISKQFNFLELTFFFILVQDFDCNLNNHLLLLP